MAALSLAKELQAYLITLLAAMDLDGLSREERDLLAMIKRQIGDIRLDTRDYEVADSRDEQLALAKAGRKSLGQLNQYILEASEQNLFGAADVAHLSTYIERISASLA